MSQTMRSGALQLAPRAIHRFSRDQVLVSGSNMVNKSFSTSKARPAHSDYGSGATSSERNPSEHLEHPGPDAPKTGSSATSTPSSTGGDGKAQPKLNEGEEKPRDSEEARKHNEEMDNRAEKSHHRGSANDPKDRVDKGYWKGEGDQ